MLIITSSLHNPSGSLQYLKTIQGQLKFAQGNEIFCQESLHSKKSTYLHVIRQNVAFCCFPSCQTKSLNSTSNHT